MRHNAELLRHPASLSGRYLPRPSPLTPVVNALGAPLHNHCPRTTGRGPRYAPDFFCATAAPINPPADASSARAPAIMATSTAIGNSNATDRTHRTTARLATHAARAPTDFVSMLELYRANATPIARQTPKPGGLHRTRPSPPGNGSSTEHPDEEGGSRAGRQLSDAQRSPRRWRNRNMRRAPAARQQSQTSSRHDTAVARVLVSCAPCDAGILRPSNCPAGGAPAVRSQPSVPPEAAHADRTRGSPQPLRLPRRTV